MRSTQPSKWVSRSAFVSATSFILLLLSTTCVFAANLQWGNFSGDNKWNTAGSASWREGGTDGVLFQTNDAVLFQGYAYNTVNIDAAGV